MRHLGLHACAHAVYEAVENCRVCAQNKRQTQMNQEQYSTIGQGWQKGSFYASILLLMHVSDLTKHEAFVGLLPRLLVF